jgi:HsdM-like protein
MSEVVGNSWGERVFEQAFKAIDDVLRKEAGCTTELDYTEQTSWLLFLKYLDGLEQDLSDQAALEGKKYSYIGRPPRPQQGPDRRRPPRLRPGRPAQDRRTHHLPRSSGKAQQTRAGTA